MRYRRVRVEGGTYFFTVVTHERKPVFSSEQAVVLLQEAIAKIQTRRPFEIDAQVMLPSVASTSRIAERMRCQSCRLGRGGTSKVVGSRKGSSRPTKAGRSQKHREYL